MAIAFSDIVTVDTLGSWGGHCASLDVLEVDVIIRGFQSPAMAIAWCLNLIATSSIYEFLTLFLVVIVGARSMAAINFILILISPIHDDIGVT